jgi:hypothetical protein
VNERTFGVCLLGAGAAFATVAFVCVFALVAAGPAAAGRTEPTPACGDAVVADWSDGRIDATYSTRCYLDALDSLPEDMRAYTSAPDDIARALRASVASRARSRPAATSSRRLSGRGPTRSLQGSAAARDTAKALPPRVAPSATSLPLPVVLVAALVLVVAVGGIVGLVARRMRLRRLAQRVAVEASARHARPTG